MKSRYFFLVFFLFLIPCPAFADDDSEDVIEDLGWVAIGAGVIATVPFVAFIKIRKFTLNSGGSTIQIAKQMAPSYKPILNFHIILNSIGYFSGMFHGLLLSSNLEPISLSLALVMTVLMISGILLRYTSSRNSKMFNRLLHGQIGLVILLIGLILLHVLTADD
ncbi:MAG: hypothetical protein HOD60_01970 [Candidatus Nitrosopelagicus sp.]|nr:hypothetical protein [Candidatus Nitrosopelagicus sp.]